MPDIQLADWGSFVVVADRTPDTVTTPRVLNGSGVPRFVQELRDRLFWANARDLDDWYTATAAGSGW
jgi:hypothetical protein